ncbi:MAG: fibronectin type III domain-containing protein [bacterium]|nr:fibronectin type III domain-containing protein [bacterium]
MKARKRLWARHIAARNKQLNGSIPTELADLTGLYNVDIQYNALWTDDATLQTFLDSFDSEWDETQTIAPEELTIASVADHTVWLEWTPITYTGDTGGYEVFSEPVVTKAPTSGGFTATKSDTTFPVTGLDPGESYDFTVSAFTNPHNHNQSKVVSESSSPEMAYRRH